MKLVTYATDNFFNNAILLEKSAKDVGFSSSTIYKPDDIKNTDFYIDNKKILEAPRGAGYWLWKPYIILEELKKANSDDIIFYCDAGRASYYSFTKYPEQLQKIINQEPKGYLLGPTIPHLGNVKNWTKRDCLILMQSDIDEILEKPLISATWSLWRPTKNSFDFLEKWLEYCSDSRCVSDEPNSCGLENYNEFIDHRHDQSIVTLLSIKENSPFIDLSNKFVHKLIKVRPKSSLGQLLYKRPQNVNSILKYDNPFMLLTEYFRIKNS